MPNRQLKRSRGAAFFRGEQTIGLSTRANSKGVLPLSGDESSISQSGSYAQRFAKRSQFHMLQSRQPRSSSRLSYQALDGVLT
jgi:hypothetical protein